MIKEIPMLYSTPMVQAIGLDRKTKTRRTKGLDLINQTPNCWRYDGQNEDPEFHWFEQIKLKDTPTEIYKSIKCPYGKVGDLIWVRETFYAFGHWIEVEKKNGKIGVQFVDETILHGNNYHYVDNPPEIVSKQRVWGLCCWYKRPAIHMPKEACRIWLQITDIHVDRLQDISEEDAISEGVEPIDDGYKNYYKKLDTISKHFLWPTAYHSFQSLWESINGSDNWDVNPWVWVISFKRVKKP